MWRTMTRWAIVAALGLLLVSCASHGGPKVNAELEDYLASQMAPDFEAQRLAKAEAYLEKHSGLSESIQQAIREGKVIVGMCPEDAHAAGGRCDMALDADPKWSAKAHPLDVALAQREHPDSSHITMTFRNRTQFGAAEPVAFSAAIDKGRVTRIERAETE